MITKTQKNILIALGITSGIGFLSLIAFKLVQRRSNVITYNLPNSSNGGSTAQSKSDDSFPLKKGSKGPKVVKLQNALISKYGRSILPRFGADGDFGDETVKALESKGLPTIIDQNQFNIIVNGSGINPTLVARKLRGAAIDKDFNQVLFTLQGLNSVSDYSSVSNIFKTYRIAGVHKTLVNGLLDSFHRPDQKQKIRSEFIRMGLKLKNGVFYLNGFHKLEPQINNRICNH